MCSYIIRIIIKAILEKWIGKYTDFSIEYTDEINFHNNYAVLQHRFGKNAWHTAKTPCGSKKASLLSYPALFPQSRDAKPHHRTSDKRLELAGIILNEHNKKDVDEESQFAYKTIGVVKGQKAFCIFTGILSYAKAHIERICDKVGNISLPNADGLPARLREMIAVR